MWNPEAPPDRRAFLRSAGCGFGALALTAMLAEDGLLAEREPIPSRRGSRTHEPTAKRVIFLFMSGGPTHVDTFDPKPELTRLHGQKLPASFGPVKTRRGVDKNKLLASKRTFKKYGQSGHRGLRLVPAHRQRASTTSACFAAATATASRIRNRST